MNRWSTHPEGEIDWTTHQQLYRQDEIGKPSTRQRLFHQYKFAIGIRIEIEIEIAVGVGVVPTQTENPQLRAVISYTTLDRRTYSCFQCHSWCEFICKSCIITLQDVTSPIQVIFDTLTLLRKLSGRLALKKQRGCTYERPQQSGGTLEALILKIHRPNESFWTGLLWLCYA